MNATHSFLFGAGLVSALVVFSAGEARADGQALHVSSSVSDRGPVSGEIGYAWDQGGLRLGAQLAGGLSRETSIQGMVYDEGTRLRARIGALATVARYEHVEASVLVSPGLRWLSSSEDEALAVSMEMGFLTEIRPTSTFTIDTGILLPFAIDIDPAVELARFPGATLLVGGTYRLSDDWAVGSRLYVTAPEGYGGDSEKSIVEWGVSLRRIFGNSRSATGALPAANTAI